MTTDNARLVEQFLRALAEERLDDAADLMTVDYVSHEPTEPEPLSRDTFLQMARERLGAITARRFDVHDQVSEGDRVATRWTITGRHTGDILGIPATGREVRIDGTDVHRVADGRVAEEWASWDAAGLLQQIGAELVEQ